MLLMLLVLQGGMAAERSNTRRTMRPKVALVVGGGGAKGAAAIGALKYVERAGIPIDMVVGTSAGAIISGLYSVGYNAEQLDSIYCAQDWLRLLGDMAMPKLKPWSKVKGIPGVMRGDRFMQKLDTLLEQRTCHFDSLPIPLRCMAVDVRDFKEVCIDSGNVAQAIRASMAVPLAFTTVERDSMLRVPSAKNSLDNFPTWSPDGSRLYYTSAHYVPHDTTMQIDRDMANHYQEVQYNLCYRDFDSVRLTLGEPHLLLDLQSMNCSATLPRVSPDGRYVIFACGQFGCFHIWHPDADIRCLDLQSLRIDSLADANSPRAESYPTWSSNGRWIIFASRRDDGNYSRVCIAHFDADGHAHKAFALPQADPEHDRLLLRSYNRPEPMVEPAPRVEL